jgi:peptide/nickel transport system permease protein
MTPTTPDTETTAPAPLPGDGEAPQMLPPSRPPATGVQLAISAVLPGGGHLLRGEIVTGGLLLLGWGIFLSTLFLSWGRIVEVFTGLRIPADGVVAAVTLGVLLLGIWGWALYDLKRRAGRPRARKGDSQWAIAARHFPPDCAVRPDRAGRHRPHALPPALL